MPWETIKQRIDIDKNNFIDTKEINDFIFDEKLWEKNLNDLWNYLNELPLFNNNEIRSAIKNGFYNSKEWLEIQQNIRKKIRKNNPLNKKELSLIYLDMLCGDFSFIPTVLSKDQIRFEANKPINQICGWQLIQFIRRKYFMVTYTGEVLEKWWNKISEDMFQQLLTMEDSQNFIAKIHKNKFWETFVTWPYGMVYKHIDENGNLLKKLIKFKEWERLRPERAKQNAKAYYDKRAQERKNLLDNKWYEYNQAQLDSLVSASWWTTTSVEKLKNFTLSHRGKPMEISKFILTFATKSAWNWQEQPWLVIRRQFESNWFKWIKKPIWEYQRKYYERRQKQNKK